MIGKALRSLRKSSQDAKGARPNAQSSTEYVIDLDVNDLQLKVELIVDDGEVEIVYSWPTRLTGRRFIGTCPPVQAPAPHIGGDFEVFVFDENVEELELEEYLARYEPDDKTPVRFNAEGPMGALSVSWTPRYLSGIHEAAKAGGCVGHVEAVLETTPQAMSDMITQSVIGAGRPHVTDLLAQGERIRKQALNSAAVKRKQTT